MQYGTLLSLFDYSGQWALPFHQAGWNVIQLDLKHGNDLNDFQSVEDVFDYGIEDVDGILAAPPCTDFSVSGAQFWKVKDESGRTEEALELVKQVMRFADLFTPTDPDYTKPFFWAMENPVGRLPKLLPEIGQPWYFNPWEFAGHLKPSKKDLARLDKIRMKNGHNVTAAENDFVIDCEAYSKKTGLWGNFNANLKKKPIEVVKCSPQGSFTQRLGGSSAKTKEERSFTPMGFAQAFFQANKNWKGYKEKNFDFICGSSEH
jgi:hypothetical protein